MAIIDDRAMASWREWIAEQDKKKSEDRCPQHGLEDQGDIMAKQVGGNHYKRAHQPWEIIEEWELNYWAGNVLKYLLRYKYKNGVEDLEKAKHYLEYLIKHENS